MVYARERSPQERETLIFSDPEAAREFSEQVAQRVAKERQPGLERRREIVGEELAKQFVRAGEGVVNLHQPWEHSEEEHQEVQYLIDTAFAKDLPVALQQARGSTHYPRNIDLFHDVLTGQLYDVLREQHLNRQPLALTLVGTLAIVLAVLVLSIIVLIML